MELAFLRPEASIHGGGWDGFMVEEASNLHPASAQESHTWHVSKSEHPIGALGDGVQAASAHAASGIEDVPCHPNLVQDARKRLRDVGKTPPSPTRVGRVPHDARGSGKTFAWAPYLIHAQVKLKYRNASV